MFEIIGMITLFIFATYMTFAGLFGIWFSANIGESSVGDYLALCIPLGLGVWLYWYIFSCIDITISTTVNNVPV